MRGKKMTDQKVAAARKLLENNTAMSVVAKKVGISVPTLYTYFPGGAKAIRAELAAKAKPAKGKKAASLKKAA